MKTTATILLFILSIGLTAYLAYAAGETKRFGEFGVFSSDKTDEKLEAYGERIRQLTNLNEVKWDMIIQYDSALGSFDDKDELMRHLERLDMLWDAYDLMVAKYKNDEDTTYLPPMDYHERSFE